jgi:hypothetical protein
LAAEEERAAMSERTNAILRIHYRTLVLSSLAICS